MSSKLEVYQACRGRLLVLAERLSAPQLRAPVPATPAWTVKDLYAHLVGGCVDFVRDNMGDAPSEKWTNRHVTDRKGKTIDELVQEWKIHITLFDRKFDRAGREASPLASDVWCHEYDLHGALGWRGSRDPERVAWGARAIRGIPQMLEGTGLPVPRVIGDGEVLVDGDGPTVKAPTYDLARMVYGRRSWQQIRAMEWSRDPTPYLEHLSFFPAPADDLFD